MDGLTRNSQKLRREMTEEERKLWYAYLRDLPVSIKRQKVIGPYIVDFYCPQRKLVIEIDGSQHYEDDAKSKDIQRDIFLKEQGITVLRYSNLDINSRFKDVCEDISQYIFIMRKCRLSPHPPLGHLPPQGEGKGGWMQWALPILKTGYVQRALSCLPLEGKGFGTVNKGRNCTFNRKDGSGHFLNRRCWIIFHR